MQPRFSFSFPAVLTLALSTAACAASLQDRSATPSGGGAGWTEVTSDHFVLRTDLGSKDASEASVSLEAMFSALAELGFASADRPKMSIDVVFFRDRYDYARILPSGTAGEFKPRGFFDFEHRPTAVLGGDFVASTRRVLQHELTHLFVHYYYPKAPVWLDEGMARYFETLTVEDGLAVLGREPRNSRFWKGPWRGTGPAWERVTWIPVSEAPTASALLDTSRRGFYGDLNADTTTSSGREAARATAVHYQAAWALVHFLLTDPAFTPAFVNYLARLHSGDSEAIAWVETVGALPRETLEAGFKASLVAKEVTTLRTKFSPPPPSAPHLRAIEAREVRILWARLRDWRNPQAHEAAAKEFEAPRAGDGNVEEATAAAFWEGASGHPVEAEGILRGALALHPDDRRLLNALGWILLGRGEQDSKEAGERLASVVGELKSVAESAAEFDLLARGAGRGGHLDDALAYEKRALAIDPSCAECLVFTAEILALKGLFREAFETVMLAQSPEAPLPPPVAASLEDWRRRAASSPAKSLAPAGSAPGAPVAVPHADAVLAAMRPRFHTCFGDSPRPAPGGVEFDVRVDAHGAVTGVEPRAGATFPPSVVDCLAGVLKSGHFPAPGAETTLNVPIRVNGT